MSLKIIDLGIQKSIAMYKRRRKEMKVMSEGVGKEKKRLLSHGIGIDEFKLSRKGGIVSCVG